MTNDSESLGALYDFEHDNPEIMCRPSEIMSEIRMLRAFACRLREAGLITHADEIDGDMSDFEREMGIVSH